MPCYEYKVVPAPVKGLKAKGRRSTADRFANALETVMNEEAADGWEYQRTDTLPCEEREGLLGKTTVFQNLMVFRRTVATDDEARGSIETAEEEADRIEAPAHPPLLEKPAPDETPVPQDPSLSAEPEANPQPDADPEVEQPRRDVAAQ